VNDSDIYALKKMRDALEDALKEMWAVRDARLARVEITVLETLLAVNLTLNEGNLL
jgi:hypothetical protein